MNPCDRARPAIAIGEADEQTDGGDWILRGNILGSPTPAKQETWGRLKARYR